MNARPRVLASEQSIHVLDLRLVACRQEHLVDSVRIAKPYCISGIAITSANTTESLNQLLGCHSCQVLSDVTMAELVVCPIDVVTRCNNTEQSLLVRQLPHNVDIVLVNAINEDTNTHKHQDLPHGVCTGPNNLLYNVLWDVR